MEDWERSTSNPLTSVVPEKSIHIYPSHLRPLKGDAASGANNEKPIFVLEAVGNTDVALAHLAHLASPGGFWKQAQIWSCSNPSPPQQNKPQQQRPGKSTSPVRTVLEHAWDKLFVLHYRFEVTFGFYVLEPWEKVGYYAIFLAFTAAVFMLLYYIPTWTIRAMLRLAWYLTGDPYDPNCDGCASAKSALRSVTSILNSTRMHAALEARGTVPQEVAEGWTYITQVAGEAVKGQTPALLNCVCSPISSH